MSTAYYEMSRRSILKMRNSDLFLITTLQVFSQTSAVSLSEGNADPQLFKILIQGFPAEIDFPTVEELPDISFEFGLA
jgi:hypothetical protein